VVADRSALSGVTEPRCFSPPWTVECRARRSVVDAFDNAQVAVRRIAQYGQCGLHAVIYSAAASPDHKLGINRRPANVAIEGRELLAKLNQYPCHHRVDPAQQMARWDEGLDVSFPGEAEVDRAAEFAASVENDA
jgi:hypothetical protein